MLRATIPNPDRFLWPGQYVDVTLTLTILKHAPVVPSQTVQIGGKGTYLFTVGQDNTVEQRLITQGVRYHDLVVVSQGVKPGETVVVEGQLALASGTKVNPQPYPTAAPEKSALTESGPQKNATSESKPEPIATKTEPAL